MPRVGDWIDARRENGLPRIFCSCGCVGLVIPYLIDERPGRELAQGRDLRFAAEATQTAVSGPIGATGDAVPIGGG